MDRDVNASIAAGMTIRPVADRIVQPPGGKPMPVDAYLRGHRPPSRAVGA